MCDETVVERGSVGAEKWWGEGGEDGEGGGGEVELRREREGGGREREGGEWVETVARVLRNMCRCGARGGLNTSNSRGVKNLPWHEEAPTAAAEPPAVKYHFDAELLLPVTVLANGTKEPGLPIDLDAASYPPPRAH